MKNLEDIFRPRLTSIPISPALEIGIDAVEAELALRAGNDPDNCFGYFPGFREEAQTLVASNRLADDIPTVEAGNMLFTHNFFRLSTVPQPSIYPYHIDSDAETAISGSFDALEGSIVWRALFNLSGDKDRDVAYLDISVADAIRQGMLRVEAGYMAYTGVVNQHEKVLTIPRRQPGLMHGAIFAANRVFHGGRDGIDGHFVAGYGSVEAI